MTPDEAYAAGYEDGKNGKATAVAHLFDENYTLGYEDGKGDRAASHPTEAGFSEYNMAPEGFEFTEEKRVPLAFEWYLSKAGNPTFLKRERKNSQTRHILKPTKCMCHLDPNRCGIHAKGYFTT